MFQQLCLTSFGLKYKFIKTRCPRSIVVLIQDILEARETAFIICLLFDVENRIIEVIDQNELA